LGSADKHTDKQTPLKTSTALQYATPVGNELECGPVPNLMAALPNIGGALCSTPQSLADAHCWSTVQ